MDEGHTKRGRDRGLRSRQRDIEESITEGGTSNGDQWNRTAATGRAPRSEGSAVLEVVEVDPLRKTHDIGVSIQVQVSGRNRFECGLRVGRGEDVPDGWTKRTPTKPANHSQVLIIVHGDLRL